MNDRTNTASAGRPRAFSVASYNIHQCVGLDGRRDVARIARVLSDLDTQLIGLQEVGTDLHGQTKSSQMEYLAHTTGLHAIAGPTLERQTGPYGNALLTGWRVLGSRLHDLTVPGREPRGAIDADLDIAGQTVRVVVTHLGLAAAERRYQVRRLLETLSDEQHQFIIILGDINEWILRSRPLRWLHARFGVPPAPRTFPSWAPLFALDRIWVLPRKALLEVRAHGTALTRIASDHLPVRALIAVNPQTGGGNGRSHAH
ncbi:MAG TPA: endonuclease/exonuclease/phosphatase family protein [Candidatus Tectomicrobia bacterium]|nr:endonuclease/exonuclease/phosphatase family protein [Candidatus Tectomicrobia bacterium]